MVRAANTPLITKTLGSYSDIKEKEIVLKQTELTEAQKSCKHLLCKQTQPDYDRGGIVIDTCQSCGRQIEPFGIYETSRYKKALKVDTSDKLAKIWG
jgi:hypothetical protein